ncbi:MAG: metallophosphoesterase family protein [Conexivisphaera sp.]
MRDPLEILEESRGVSADAFEDLLARSIELMGGDELSCGNLARRGGLVRLEHGSGQIVVIGDLHGDAETLRSILAGPARAALDSGALVFLGDYVDRGPAQAEVLYTVLALKLEYPGSVVALRGNHEPPPWLPPAPHDYPEALLSRFGQRGRDIYARSLELFQRLPHAAVSRNGIFMVHGGPPSEPRRLADLERPSKEDLEDMLWSDPTSVPGSAPSPRGAGHLYGPDVTARFLSENGLSLIVRSHEPCDGYRIDHGGRVVTIFSRKGPPYMNRSASYFRASASDPPGPPESHVFLI